MRKNFILTMLMFLFINILSIANENLPAVNTNINNMNPAYDESLKEYKIQVENTEKLYNYIEKTIKENSITTVMKITIFFLLKNYLKIYLKQLLILSQNKYIN